MRHKSMAAVVLAVVLVALTGATSAQGASTFTPKILIQDATLTSSRTVLVTGTSNCDVITGITVFVREDDGAVGAGTEPAEPAGGNWSVTATAASLPFTKGKASILVDTTCNGAHLVEDSRTILVH